ncbi:hypothetical protein BDV12DRAFT_115530 [Aspergillus spectabilis]
MTSRHATEGGDGGSGNGGLFQGMSFWLSQNVPQRSRFKELVQQNDGIVKPIEKDADVQIVDHKRKNLPANVYSYQFIERSVQNGRLEDLEAHRAGPSTARPVGATDIPARGHRLAYSLQDDQFIWDYMQPYERDSSAAIRGNKIYQELAAKNPRHPWQSWRDRYLKRLQGLARPGGMVEPAANGRTGEAIRRNTPPRATTSRRAAAGAKVNETPQKPQERKRKRSPEPTTLGERASNSVPSAQQRGATTQRPLAPRPPVVVEPPAYERSYEREPSRHEGPSSPKKPKTTKKQSPEKITTRQPVGEASTGIDSLFLELPFLPSSPGADEAPEQDIDSWIDSRLSTGKGNEAQIIEALQCTSMDPDLADKVLGSLVAGKGIPTDMRGVWTTQDDECVEAQDTREIERALKKHGTDLFNARWEYLKMARDEGLENPSTT